MLAEFEWYETRLTVARWHLDAAVSVSRETAAVHLRQAGEMVQRLRERLIECKLGEEQRRRIVVGLDELAARLIAVRRRD
jgi:hypothetical protein